MTTTAIETTNGAKPQGFQAWLASPEVKAAAAAMLPKHVSMERMLRVVSATVKQSKDLMEVANKNPQALLRCFADSTQLGLEPGLLGHAYIVPFRDKGKPSAQLIVGYRGLMDLARRSGQLREIYAHAVRKNDIFAYEFGLNQSLTHKPGEGSPTQRGEITHVYAVAKLKDGATQFVVMSKAEVDAVKSQSKAGNFGPWKQHYEEMACKTAIRRLSKWLPMSIEFARAEARDFDTVVTSNGNGSLLLDDGEIVDDGDADAIEAEIAEAKQEFKCPDHGALPVGEKTCPDCGKSGAPSGELFDASSNQGAFE